MVDMVGFENKISKRADNYPAISKNISKKRGGKLPSSFMLQYPIPIGEDNLIHP